MSHAAAGSGTLRVHLMMMPLPSASSRVDTSRTVMVLTPVAAPCACHTHLRVQSVQLLPPELIHGLSCRDSPWPSCCALAAAARAASCLTDSLCQKGGRRHSKHHLPSAILPGANSRIGIPVALGMVALRRLRARVQALKCFLCHR